MLTRMCGRGRCPTMLYRFGCNFIIKIKWLIDSYFLYKFSEMGLCCSPDPSYDCLIFWEIIYSQRTPYPSSRLLRHSSRTISSDQFRFREVAYPPPPHWRGDEGILSRGKCGLCLLVFINLFPPSVDPLLVSLVVFLLLPRRVHRKILSLCKSYYNCRQNVTAVTFSSFRISCLSKAFCLEAPPRG